jgi:hypothetical protein
MARTVGLGGSQSAPMCLTSRVSAPDSTLRSPLTRTDFPWYEFGGEELATRLKKQFSSLTREFLIEGGDLFRVYPTILERLMPYRCAKIITPPAAETNLSDLRMFLTREEVRWNEFPETGMYVIIDNNVYDVSGTFTPFSFVDIRGNRI